MFAFRSGEFKPGNALAKAWDRGKTQWFAVIEGLGTRLDVVASFINRQYRLRNGGEKFERLQFSVHKTYR